MKTTTTNKHSPTNLSGYLSELFNRTALGIQYWHKHKAHKCYKCHQYGHIAANCQDICPSCNNLHNGTVCVHSVQKLYKKIIELLKRNIVIDEEKLMNRIEKAQNELNQNNAETLLKDCQYRLDFNNENKMCQTWQISYKPVEVFKIKYDAAILKPSVQQRLDVHANSIFKMDSEHGSPSSKSLGIQPPTTYLFKPLTPTIYKKRIDDKYFSIINAKILTIQARQKELADIEVSLKQQCAYNMKLSTQLADYEYDSLIKKGSLPGRQYKASTGWFYNPDKWVEATKHAIKENRAIYEDMVAKRSYKQEVIKQLYKECDNLNVARDTERNLQILKNKVTQPKGQLSLTGTEIAIKAWNPYRAKINQISGWLEQIKNYQDQLSSFKSSMQEMRVAREQLASTKKKLSQCKYDLYYTQDHYNQVLSDMRQHADEKIQKKYDKLHAKQAIFYEKKNQHYRKINQYVARTKQKAKNMGNIVRQLDAGYQAHKKTSQYNQRGTVTISYKTGGCSFKYDVPFNSYEVMKEKLMQNMGVVEVSFKPNKVFH